MDYEANARDYVLHALRRPGSAIFTRAEGSRLWDIHGKVYLDTMSGSAGPAMVGHANARVAAAVARQMAILPSVNIVHDSVPVIEFCTRMANLAPAGLSKTFLCVGGGEAVEAAIKFAMRVTGRTQALSLSGAYHGQSLATMGLTAMPALRKLMPPALVWQNFRQIPSADAYRPLFAADPQPWKAALQALENELAAGNGNLVAALIMEVVQGPNGHSVYSPEYYEAVRAVCHRHGALLIVDEVQTGLSRSGATWACELYGVQPDILIAGKALGGGVPIGAFLTRKDLIPDGLESEPWHMLTFMNQPLTAAAGLAVLDIVEEEKLSDRAQALGAQATERFRALAKRFDVIGDVRGPGLFIGVEFVEDRQTKIPAVHACRKAWDFATARGLIVQFGGAAGNVYKFKPPLTTPQNDFDRMLDISEEMIAFIQGELDEQRRVPTIAVPAGFS